jgi:hypothetical protein
MYSEYNKLRRNQVSSVDESLNQAWAKKEWLRAIHILK